MLILSATLAVYGRRCEPFSGIFIFQFSYRWNIKMSLLHPALRLLPRLAQGSYALLRSVLFSSKTHTGMTCAASMRRVANGWKGKVPTGPVMAVLFVLWCGSLSTMP